MFVTIVVFVNPFCPRQAVASLENYICLYKANLTEVARARHKGSGSGTRKHHKQARQGRKIWLLLVKTCSWLLTSYKTWSSIQSGMTLLISRKLWVDILAICHWRVQLELTWLLGCSWLSVIGQVIGTWKYCRSRLPSTRERHCHKAPFNSPAHKHS